MPALVRPKGHLGLLQPRLVAGLPAALVGVATGDVGLTLAAGMVVLVGLGRP